MASNLTRAAMERLARQPVEQRARLLASVGPAELLKWDAWFEAWADPAQLPPEGEGWRTWLLMAGRGFGKTRAGAEWVHQLAMPRRGTRIALVGATISEAQAVMVEGRSGVIAAAASHGVRLKWEPSRGRLTWPTGTVAELFSGDSPDGLRGPEHHYAWVLTFELVADEEDVATSSVLNEISDGAVTSNVQTSVEGYAAYGRSRADAAFPLIDLMDLSLVSSAGRLVEPDASVPLVLSDDDLGASVEGDTPRIERWSTGEHLLPERVTIDHYDASRDYHVSRVSAQSGYGYRTRSINAPMVIDVGQARGLAEGKIARAFRERDRIKLSLPPKYMSLRPGQLVKFADSDQAWRCLEVRVEAFATEVVVAPEGKAVSGLPADGGRHLQAPDIVAAPTVLALFDPPDFGQGPVSALMLAAANSNDGWRAVPTEISVAGQPEQGFTAARETYLGHAEDALGAASGLLIDERNSVTVQMVDQAHELLSLSDVDLMAGANLALLGDEVIQFGQADYLGNGRYRLSRLLRGLKGSEWSAAHHFAGEPFTMLATDRMASILIDPSKVGSNVSALAEGMADGNSLPVARIANGEALRPPSPAHLRASTNSSGDIFVTWVRRSRAGFAWLGGEDAPMGETIAGYDVDFVGTQASISRTFANESASLESPEASLLGAGPLTISVRMKGEFARSRPASVVINI